MMMCSNTVWEMKNNEKVAKQLYAKMFCYGYHITVKALKEEE